MIEINLLPQEYRRKDSPRFVLPEIPIKKTLQTLLWVILGIQIAASIWAVYQSIELARVKNEIASISAGMTEIAQKKEETRQNNERIRKMNSLMTRKFSWAGLLSNLVQSTSKGVWFSNLTVREEKSVASKASDAKSLALRLEGSVVGQGEETAVVGKFIKELKANAFLSEIFREVELSSFIQKKIRELDVYDFSIVCFFKQDKISAP